LHECGPGDNANLTKTVLVYIITGYKEKISRLFADVKIIRAFHSHP